jgi:hypothetical protein
MVSKPRHYSVPVSCNVSVTALFTSSLISEWRLWVSIRSARIFAPDSVRFWRCLNSSVPGDFDTRLHERHSKMAVTADTTSDSNGSDSSRWGARAHHRPSRV